jgi:hypothetical protein
MLLTGANPLTKVIVIKIIQIIFYLQNPHISYASFTILFSRYIRSTAKYVLTYFMIIKINLLPGITQPLEDEMS